MSPDILENRRKCASRRISAAFLFCLVLFFPLHQAAFAQTYHVATTGSDTPGDGSRSGPWTTISHAIGEVPDQSLILVAAGTYHAHAGVAASAFR